MKRHFPLVLLCGSALLFGSTFLFSTAHEHLEMLRLQRDRQKAEKAAIEQRVRHLKSILVGVEENPRVLEKIAREQLRLVRDGEELVLFED